MRLSIVPQERRFYELFKKMGELISETLGELSRSLLEGRSRHPRLRDLERLLRSSELLVQLLLPGSPLLVSALAL